MPTYQYACTECGHRLEAVQSFTDEPLAECPECAGRLRKVFSAVGVVFKGSGFYRTDSRTSGKSGSGGSASKNGSSTETAGSKGSSSEGSSSKESSSSGTSTSSNGSSATSSSTTAKSA